MDNCIWYRPTSHYNHEETMSLQIEARATRKEAKLVNKATKATMRGNITKAANMQV